MNNMQDFIGNITLFKKWKVDDLLFAEFECPPGDGPESLWWHNNFFVYILSGYTVMKTPKGEYVLNAGEFFFAKKGSVLIQDHSQDLFCELLVFMPDDFIKYVINKHRLPLPAAPTGEGADTIIPLPADEVLVTYFHSLLSHFRQENPPPPGLLKLKFEELIINILSGNSYQPLADYFSELYAAVNPSIKDIMEANFASNLSLDEFARLCARSLSSFKLEFKNIFHTTPGKWLLTKRLEYSHFLLETTNSSIDEICMESGFENRSHFIRVFKDKYGVSPGKFRMLQKQV
jgi:AraC-like DNA-binding protein